MSVEEVLSGVRRWHAEAGDCIERMNALSEKSVDLVFGSPPYLEARLYLEKGADLGVARKCQAWVEWMLEVSTAAARVSRGLVCWVVAGVQRKNCYQPGPEGLMWEWYKRGNHLWCPSIWRKVGDSGTGSATPGSGGRQGLRKDWEYVLLFKPPGSLPWADNTALGHPPIEERVGGEMSNRNAEGRRINQTIGNVRAGKTREERWGGSTKGKGGESQPGSKDGARKKTGKSRRLDGKQKETGRPMPKLANPGNFIEAGFEEAELEYVLGGDVVNARVGGGHMGSRLCHLGEAPFPEKLARFFIRSYCPPGGLVLDPFCGTGTSLAVAVHEGRRGLGFDLRPSQVEITQRRVEVVTPPLFADF